MRYLLAYFNQHLYKKYFSYWIVLLIDSILSVVSTCITMFFVSGVIAGINKIAFLSLLFCSFIFSLTLFYFLKVDKNIIRHASVRSIGKIVFVVLLKEICLLAVVVIAGNWIEFRLVWVYCFIDLLLSIVLLVGSRVFLLLVYDLVITQVNFRKTRVLVYGTDDQSVSLKQRLYTSKHYQVVGYINPSKHLKSYRISELPVYHFKDEANFRRFVSKYNIGGIIFPSDKAVQDESDQLVKFSQNIGIKSLVSPSIDIVGTGLKKTAIREVKIEDLLGRDEIKISMQEIIDNFSGKSIMITGAAGSIGSELCRQIATFGVKHLVLYDNAETPMHEIRLELEKSYPHLSFTPFIGDVRNKERLRMAFEKFHPQVVFHAAAYKHVPLMEENPCEAVRVNVVGSRLVADFCVQYNVEKMIMISTDKAVNPTNVMGASKRLAEIYVQSLGLAMERGEIQGVTKFVTTRFGNVLGSNGSVIPYFRKQISTGGPVTVTDPKITRFFMTIPEACRLVMEAATMSTGNQIFVFDMGKPVKIVDLAERMIRLAGYVPNEDIEIKFTGLRPGEKLYEEVLSNEENTIPTDHYKIRIAKVREYSRDAILPSYDKLANLALLVRIDDTVRLMKQVVPEFKSNNSIYEKLDKELCKQEKKIVL